MWQLAASANSDGRTQRLQHNMQGQSYSAALQLASTTRGTPF
jgi:hypothetical protein